MNAQASVIDFGAVLYMPETLYEAEVDGTCVMYAPDSHGWPVRVSASTRSLLKAFHGGTPAGHVVATELQNNGGWRDLDEIIGAIADLESHGLLRPHPAVVPYARIAPPGQPPKSASVWLHVTNHCNLACGYCFVEGKTRDVMSAETVAKTATRLAHAVRVAGMQALTIKFAGGEPALALPTVEAFRDHLDTELAEHSAVVHYSILTNGTRVQPRLLRFLERPRTSISISVDGYGDAHDVHRRTLATSRPTWYMVSRNVDALIGRGVRPYMMITITRETAHSLADIVYWTAKRGLRMRIGVVRDFRPADLTASDRDYCDLLKKSFEEALARLERDPDLQVDPRTVEICELGFATPSQWLCCGLGFNHIVIGTDGCVSRCPMTVGEPGVDGDDLVEACRRAASALRVDKGEDKCLMCRWFPVCVGGCPVANERTTGASQGPSPLCDFYRFVIPRFVEFFARTDRKQRLPPEGEHSGM